ncbi:MAG: CPXCG motif-containing cysteine-rich protein [Marinobacter sp.]|uniref:CPXCG motif-containing cysteine-rich protein n=1 Tax=Marinobacter sp. TaxID=50741 RepID=UPI00299D9C97|nr:CPXCG motif-containing cysteine-rich protein [Marinobacter sp.]MDX1635294.1 CPXCG motif-containing cysteine-rich protein [Marinobacter sp.]
MPAMDTASIQCPYCWEPLELAIDPAVDDQEYVEDCYVCCQPILIHAIFDEDRQLRVSATAENE